MFNRDKNQKRFAQLKVGTKFIVGFDGLIYEKIPNETEPNLCCGNILYNAKVVSTGIKVRIKPDRWVTRYD